MIVTVDAARGAVYEGDVTAASARAGQPVATRRDRESAAAEIVPETLATRVYVNLAMRRSGRAGRGAARRRRRPAARRVHAHRRARRRAPAPAARARAANASSSTGCAASLLRITRAFAPRPVVYRTIDFRSNEFRGLEGGAAFEPVEDNPMIGYRGCYRYVREPDLFRLELRDPRPRPRRDAEPAPHDPVRAHALGARDVPRARRREPARARSAACTAG